MELTKNQISTILEASTILGTGGGGRYDSALDVIKNIKTVNIVKLQDLLPEDVVITAYGAGGLTKTKNTKAAIVNGLRILQQRLGRPIKAIVPVEIGPYSLAAAFEMADFLGVPVVDGDLVGFRSVPEIYIEQVTLAGIDRCPLVFGNNEGDLLLLESAGSPDSLESIIRSFADKSQSNTFVLGYPLSPLQLKRCLAAGSVSYCLEFSKTIQKDFRFIAEGEVTGDQKSEVNGFTIGRLSISSKKARYSVDYKNEYLGLLKNNKVLVTCPDFICIVDNETGLGLNNGNDNIGKYVKIYVKPAIAAWRTKQGLALFSPEKLGMSYKQKVIKI